MDVGTRAWRKAFGRVKAGHCYAHNFPVEPSNTFDGGLCSLGCKVLNTVRAAQLRRFREEHALRR